MNRVRAWVVGGLMLLAALTTVAMTPRNELAASRPPVDLESLLPERFGAWHVVVQPLVGQIAVEDRGVEQLSRVIYSQTAMRTYENAGGERVMLAVAYGARQNRDLQVHRPEVCYVAQGFELVSSRRTDMSGIPLKQIVARNGRRIEPVSYWIRIGDHLVAAGFESKWAIVKAGIMGDVPDGVLVRASTLAPDIDAAGAGFAVQEVFLRDLLAALTPDARALLAGAHAAR